MNHRIACFTTMALLGCLTSIAAAIGAWQTSPTEIAKERTFRVQTELVEVRAVVTDRHGRMVEDLRQEDFELLENNEPQEISFFSVAHVGEEEKTALPDTAQQPGKLDSSGLRDRLNAPPARSTILFVDNLRLEFRHLTWFKQNLHRFINEKMTEQDMIAIVTSDGSLGIAQQFTRDRRILHSAIDQIRLGPISWETAEFNATLSGRIMRGDEIALEKGKGLIRAEQGIEDRSGVLTRTRAESILSEASYFRETMLLTLKALIEQLAGMPGQRLIAIFSEGKSQIGRDGWPDYTAVRAAIYQAVRSGVVLYSIDAKGLTFEDPDYEKQDALIALARETGGEFYTNDNNFSGLIGRAFNSNRFYYILAYYLKPGSDPQKFRSIEVRIRNHPEYRVRTPKGYVPSDMQKMIAEEREKTPQERLMQAVNAPLPTTNLSLSARMDFVGAEGNSQQVALTVLFDGDTLQYRQQDQRHVFTVDVLYVIHDSSGQRVDGLSTNVQGILTPERLILARTNGYLFSKRLTLKPGTYQARVGVREDATGRMGTTSAWVEVPDLQRSKIALSSLLFIDPPPAANAGADPENPGALKRIAMVQGVRLFPRDNDCRYAFRIFRSAKSPVSNDLTMKTELLRNGKPVLQSSWRPISGSGKKMGSREQVYVGDKVNLRGLDPGIYELSVSVRDARSKKIARRTALIGVE